MIDILEPHGDQYKDNLAKAKGFARYAEEEPRIGRIQLIRKYGEKYMRLDMAKRAVRDKVLHAVNNDELDHIFDTDAIEEK